ncbi:hypothetical protein DNI29_11555 [Hymenobacter sediminis]|uniref:hypothetical protein n=1 Tax=Hymenobacter sediminis TaxID=2218621 RepID=UPI000DA67690|nr:hypothetical protein [Hymenobacter sediminis]RPD46794.1 hypothetical protein DNI29_11555 [Hymenobacter sediminis]
MILKATISVVAFLLLVNMIDPENSAEVRGRKTFEFDEGILTVEVIGPLPNRGHKPGTFVALRHRLTGLPPIGGRVGVMTETHDYDDVESAMIQLSQFGEASAQQMVAELFSAYHRRFN